MTATPEPWPPPGYRAVGVHQQTLAITYEGSRLFFDAGVDHTKPVPVLPFRCVGCAVRVGHDNAQRYVVDSQGNAWMGEHFLEPWGTWDELVCAFEDDEATMRAIAQDMRQGIGALMATPPPEPTDG